MIPGISQIKSYIEQKRLRKALNDGVAAAVNKFEKAGYTTNYHGQKIGDEVSGYGLYSGLVGDAITAKKNGDSVYFQFEDTSLTVFEQYRLIGKKHNEKHKAIIWFTTARFEPGMEDAQRELKGLEKDNIFLVEGADIEKLNQVLDKVLF